MTGPVLDGQEHAFVFGRQLDIRVIRSADFDGGTALTDQAVAGYIAKYATKGAETATGTLDHRIRLLAEIAHTDITDHARRLIRTCWELGARRDLVHLRLRAWAHMLGFRGHFSTKTRRYSTTLTSLRQARVEWRRLQAALARGEDAYAPPPPTFVLAHWAYAGTGLTEGERWLTDVLQADRTEGARSDA